LFELILEKCAEAERAFERGEMLDLNYRIMCHRMRDANGVENMAKKYCVSRNLGVLP
jgi:hypothetical protein